MLDHIVDAANVLSGQRPGARRETLASYIKRLQDLGVSRFMVPPPGFDPESITQGLERLGNEVLAKL